MDDKKNRSNVIDFASRRKAKIDSVSQTDILGENLRGPIHLDGGPPKDFAVLGLTKEPPKPIDLAKHRKVKSQTVASNLCEQAAKLEDDPDTIEEAIVLYVRAITFDPMEHATYVNLGNCFFRQGDTKHASLLYHKALEINDTNAEAHYNLGYLLFDKKKWDEAIPFFVRAIRINKNFADAHFDLALCYESTSRRAMAKPYWERYIALAKDRKEDQKYVTIAKNYLNSR